MSDNKNTLNNNNETPNAIVEANSNKVEGKKQSLMEQYADMIRSFQEDTYQTFKFPKVKLSEPMKVMMEIHAAKMYVSKTYNTTNLQLKGVMVWNETGEDNEGNEFCEQHVERRIIYCPQSFMTQMINEYNLTTDEKGIINDIEGLKRLVGQRLAITYSGLSEYEGKEFKSFYIQFMNHVKPTETKQEKLPIENPKTIEKPNEKTEKKTSQKAK